MDIKQIAALSGVAPSTVSRAFSPSSRRISAATRQRILKIARELNYMPNAAARFLSKRGMDMIGLYWNHGQPAELPSFSELLAGISRVLREQHYHLLVALQDGRGSAPSRLLSERCVDGMIIAHAEDLEVMRVLKANQIPLVLAHSALRHDCDCVAIDDVASAAACVEYLAKLGHRRIGYVNDWVAMGHTASREQRVKGYLKGMVCQGLQGPDGYEEFRPVAERIGYLFEGSDSPTALICYDDSVAAKSIECLSARGLRVPEDVSVVGFNDSEIARVAAVPITSVRLPVGEVGSLAGSMILDRIENPKQPFRNECLRGELVARRSTCEIRA